MKQCASQRTNLKSEPRAEMAPEIWAVEQVGNLPPKTSEQLEKAVHEMSRGIRHTPPRGARRRSRLPGSFPINATTGWSRKGTARHRAIPPDNRRAEPIRIIGAPRRF